MTSFMRETGPAAPTAAQAGKARPPILGLDETVERGAAFLLSLQAADGYWWAELEANVTMAAEHLLLDHFLGIADANRWAQLTRYLWKQQTADGSWAVYYNGPGDVSVTVEAYFALGYVPDPHTIYKHAYKLAPGHRLLVKRGEPLGSPQRYWLQPRDQRASELPFLRRKGFPENRSDPRSAEQSTGHNPSHLTLLPRPRRFATRAHDVLPQNCYYSS